MFLYLKPFSSSVSLLKTSKLANTLSSLPSSFHFLFLLSFKVSFQKRTLHSLSLLLPFQSHCSLASVFTFCWNCLWQYHCWPSKVSWQGGWRMGLGVRLTWILGPTTCSLCNLDNTFNYFSVLVSSLIKTLLWGPNKIMLTRVSMGLAHSWWADCFSGSGSGVGQRMCVSDKFHGDMDAAGQEPHIETHSSLDLCHSMCTSSMDITRELSRTASPRPPESHSACSWDTRFLCTWRCEKQRPVVRYFLVLIPVKSVTPNALFLSSFRYSFNFPDSIFSWFPPVSLIISSQSDFSTSIWIYFLGFCLSSVCTLHACIG